MKQKELYRRTPLMGWASWNCFRTGISEEILKEQADALVNTGLAECGYTYFNIDDGFFGGRSEDGELLVHKERFPNGMKVLADYVHRLGLKAGIYAEGGDHTCGHYYDAEGENGAGTGLYGYEEQDLRRYLVEWDYDFIKVDWCGGIRMGLDEERQYTKIGKIIEDIRAEQQKCIVYNVCRWQFPGPWVTEIADSWRTGADISPKFESVLYQLDMIKPLRRYCRPGHVNDLDMLQVGNGMTPSEDEAHFAMWCMMSTPLMLGCDLTKISENLIKLVTNKELIAIHQDEACLQAGVVKEVRRNQELLAEVWVKELGRECSQEKAIAFLNRSREQIQIVAAFSELGLGDTAEALHIRDVLRHEDVKTEQLIRGRACQRQLNAYGSEGEKVTADTDPELRLILEPHSCQVYRIKEEPVPEALHDQTDGLCREQEPAGYEPQYIEVTVPEYRPCRISLEEAICLAEQGAQFADVRFPEEYGQEGNAACVLPDDAVRIPYYEMHASARNLLPDKDRKIILCCNTGKKSSQAARSLFYLGYQDVCYTSIFAN